MRTQSLKVFLLKPGVGQYIAMHAKPGISSLLISTLPVHSPAFFPKPLKFFLCQLWLTLVPVQASRIKQVTLLDAGSCVECSRNINKLQNMRYCFLFCFLLLFCVPKLCTEFDLWFQQKRLVCTMTCGMNNMEID